MKITEIIGSSKPSLSFEVFPPKTSDNFETVKKATEEIALLKPSYMSVTYGAGGGTSQYTVSIAENLQKNFSVPSLAHLSCVSSTKDEIKSQLGLLKEKGIENILALRGDIPEEKMGEDRSKWDYRYAVDLIRELKETDPDFCIGGACYPEGHIECVHKSDDIHFLKEKVDAGCDFLTTQMFFDNNIFYNFLYRVKDIGINVPVVPGIMPITTAKQLSRSVQLSGTAVPERFKAIVDRFGDDPVAMRQAGIIYATEQIIDLIANGITHVHVYSMNKPDVASDILYNLKGIIN